MCNFKYVNNALNILVNIHAAKLIKTCTPKYKCSTPKKGIDVASSEANASLELNHSHEHKMAKIKINRFSDKIAIFLNRIYHKYIT